MSQPRRRTVQDDERERQIARMLRLARADARNGTDAYDEAENPYELKSTTKNDIGTGRDVGEAYLSMMERRYLICAFGENTNFSFNISALYLMTPDGLTDWIRPRREKMMYDQEILERLLRLGQAEISAEDAQRLRYLVARGSTLNNPKISRAFVQSHGFVIDGDEPALQLRELVRQNPL